MSKLKTTIYGLNTESTDQPKALVDDIHKEPFTPEKPDRKELAKNKAISEINRMINKDRPEPPSLTNQGHRIIEKNSVANNHPNEVEKEALFNTHPKVPDDAFPPSLQSAVDAACHGTEAHPMAVAIHYVAYFAAHIGQQRYIRIGNDKHGLGFYGILVGRSGKVKGTAEAQAGFIERLATSQLQEQFGYIPPRKLSGLSSGEGLIQVIKDPEDENDDKGITDKRLLVTESEYANVLTQDQRSGNTLSMVLRDAFDGKTLSNITVCPRMATSPHVSIIGHITPGELTGHKSFVSQTANGALNRNLIFFARRERTEPIPRAYSREEVEGLSQWFADSVIRARDEATTDNYLDKQVGREMIMSSDAYALITEEYHLREAAQDAMPELLANMVSRHRVFVWRLSAIFALMDNTDIVQADHVRQAYCWLDYSAASIRYLLNTASQEAEQEKVISLADTVYEFLLTYDNGSGASSTEISKFLFSNNKKAEEISAALKSLTESIPPRVEPYQPERKGRGRKKVIFRPLKTKQKI